MRGATLPTESCFRSGFGKLYDGVFSYLIHKNLTKFVEDGMTKKLSDEEVNEEPDLDVKDFLISVCSVKDFLISICSVAYS